jgi:copper oxidase (laccase) domain-containing protein
MNTYITGHTTKQQPLEALLPSLGLENWPYITMDQVHSDTIKEYNKGELLVIPQTDAVFTREKNVVLSVRTADCLPVLFYHPSGLVGGIHAGRVGTQKEITAKTFSLLAQQFGLNSEFWIWFGPAICKSCYQIDPVLDIHYDLIEENKAQLNPVLDMKTCHLELSGHCTSCQNDRFFSYRKEKTDKRLFSVIALKE